MPLTREETLEYLSGYSKDPEQISLVLLELGEDPDGTEYPDDIVERAEVVFKTLGTAKYQALASGQDNSAIAVRETSEIAVELLEEQGISFPAEVVMVLATAAIEEGAQLARNIQGLKRAALIKGLRTGNDELAEELLETFTGSSSIIQEVFTPENVEVLVSSVVPDAKKPNVAAFLSRLNEQKQSREQLQSTKQEKRAALQPAKVDVKAFLAARKK